MKITRKALVYNLREDGRTLASVFAGVKATLDEAAQAMQGYARVLKAASGSLKPWGDHGTDPFAEQDE